MKDKVREALATAKLRAADAVQEYRRTGVLIGASDQLQNILGGIDEALAALDDDGWVKCSERLPQAPEPHEYAREYVIQFSDGDVGVGWYVGAPEPNPKGFL